MGFYAKDEPARPTADKAVARTLSRARKPRPENVIPPILTVVTGHRFYNPELGRWVCRDPIGEIGGLNLHASVQNAPLHVIDPIGLATSFETLGDPNDEGRNGCGRGAFVSIWVNLDADFIVYSSKYLWKSRDCDSSVWSNGTLGPVYAHDEAGSQRDGLRGEWGASDGTARVYINPINTGSPITGKPGDESYFGNGPLTCTEGSIHVIIQWRTYRGKYDPIYGQKSWPVKNPEDPAWHEKQKGWPAPIRRKPNTARLQESDLIEITVKWNCCDGNDVYSASISPPMNQGPNRYGRD
jgi:uncharacterized protein RhaS with RHS repeats